MESSTLVNESTPKEELRNGETIIKSEYKTRAVHITHIEPEASASEQVTVVTVESIVEQNGEESKSDGESLVVVSPEPGSPSKKRGAKVKKSTSFKDTLVKKFSKKGERPAKDHNERSEK